MDLDFTLNTSEKRATFVRQNIQFLDTYKPELLANYILWGDKTQKDIILPSKWNDTTHTQSLDALLEQPTFNEATLKPLTHTPYTFKRETFSRSKARAQAPPHIKAELETLWRQIDTIDYTLYAYEHKPVRPELDERLNDHQKSDAISFAATLTPYKYLRLKRQLVDLRSTQYTLRDSYAPTLMPVAATYAFSDSITLKVKPFAYMTPDNLEFLWDLDTYPSPDNIPAEKLKSLMAYTWQTDTSESELAFDFTDPAHLAAAYKSEDLPDELLKRLNLYERLANLTPPLRAILDYRKQGISTLSITHLVNQEFNKTYNSNYVSTLFHQKILGSIAEAALIHRKCVENLPFEEEWIRCKDCGRLLLKDPYFFMRNGRNSSGYSIRCKECAKKRRTKQ